MEIGDLSPQFGCSEVMGIGRDHLSLASCYAEQLTKPNGQNFHAHREC